MSHDALNPNHPVVRQVAPEWHKFCALVMHKLGAEAVEITAFDISAIVEADRANVVIDTRGGRCVLRLVTNVEAARLAREEGGLPT